MGQKQTSGIPRETSVVNIFLFYEKDELFTGE